MVADHFTIFNAQAKETSNVNNCYAIQSIYASKGGVNFKIN